MTTTVCCTSSVHSSSFFTFEDLNFSQAFRRTHSDHLSTLVIITESKPECAGGSIDDYDFGTASCTESLGFESSNIMVSDSSCDCCSSDRMMSEDYCSGERKERKESSSPLPEMEMDFPPPMSSLSENGQRSFTLMPVRNNGRLEIVRVPISRPEILYSSRQNGRLLMRLVRSFADDEYEYEEEEEEADGENGENVDEEADEKEKSETAVVAATDEDREWKIPVLRRCYQSEVLYAWAQQQNRYVTTV